MRELHLFAGAGGGVLGGKLLGHQQIGYVEREPYRCRVLAQRIKDGILDDAPVYCGTVREFIDTGYAAAYSGLVDVICAGFPCPPFSLAGKRLADKDSRNAWPETRDAIEVIRPRFAFLENVPGLITSPYLETICGDLCALGYRIRATVIGALDAGAPHIRKRLWMLAYTDNLGCEKYTRSSAVQTEHASPDSMYSESDNANPIEISCHSRPKRAGRKARADINRGGEGPNVADSESVKCGAGLCQNGPERDGAKATNASCNRINRWWDAEPSVGRVADGVANRVDRLESIGDGQVPAVVRLAWETLMNG